MACNPSCFTYFLPESGGKLILNQTGTKLGALGKITIQPEADTITAELVTESEYETRDKETQDFVDSINKEFESVLNEVVAHTDVDLTTLNPETEERMVRSQETNLGDLCADAYRWALDADIGLVNGGGIRADIAAGDITYGQYTVVAGDSLWKIAQSKLGDGQRWKEIYEQNKDSVSNPSVILVGQELKLPAA